MSQVSDVVTFLVAKGLVDGATGWPTVRGVLHDGSDQLVAVRRDGGISPEVGRSSGMGDVATRFPRVHITVRGQPNDRDATESKALAIYDVLHGYTGTMGSTYYGLCTADSDVIEVGQDDRARRLFTLAVTLRTAQGAPA